MSARATILSWHAPFIPVQDPYYAYARNNTLLCSSFMREYVGHPIFFSFALKTVKSRVLEMRDIVARALIYSTVYHYMGLILNQ